MRANEKTRLFPHISLAIKHVHPNPQPLRPPSRQSRVVPCLIYGNYHTSASIFAPFLQIIMTSAMYNKLRQLVNTQFHIMYFAINAKIYFTSLIYEAFSNSACIINNNVFRNKKIYIEKECQ